MKKIRFSDILTIKPKSKVKAGEGLDKGHYPFFTSSANLSKYIDNYLFDKPSLIFGTGGQASVHYCDSKFNVLTDCFVAQANNTDECNVKFVYYFFKGHLYLLEREFKGAGLKHISKKAIENINIPLPPLSEQKRIAAILDKADALRQKNKQLLDAYDELLQSVFLELFGDPVTNPKGWAEMEVSKIAKTRLGKMLDKKTIRGDCLKPYLRNANVLWFEFSLDDLLKMDFDEKDLLEFQLKYGDVLMCEGGEIGRCAVWKKDMKDVYFQKAIHRIRLDKNLMLPDFFVRMFWFYAMNGGLNKFLGAATIRHLTGINLRKIKLPVPPINLQTKFTKIVKNIESQKYLANQSLQESEDLFNGLVHKALKGS